jgi:general stress protein 26
METQQLLENVQRLLREQHIAVVGTIESNGQPHGATIFCVMHEDGTIFFPTRTSSRKYKNSQTNPLISLVVTHPTEPITVQMHGTIAETTDPAMTQHAIEHLMTCTADEATKQRWLPPVKRIRDGQFTIMHITPTWIRYSDFRTEEHRGEKFIHEVTL